MQRSHEADELIADIREQVLYMQELGVETLDLSLSEISVGMSSVIAPSARGPESRPISNFRSEISNAPSATTISSPTVSDSREEQEKNNRPRAGSRLASLPSLSKRTVNKFFDKYNPEEAKPAESVPSSEEKSDGAVLRQAAVPDDEISTVVGAMPVLPKPIETVEQIRAEIGHDCTTCKLSGLGRSKVVNSVGNFNADLMFVGEAPGADEDRLGEPFVGRAGQLLTDIIRAMGFDREQVFIGNINRCRPPDNRTPEPDESVVCKPFLVREIAVVRPKVIVVLGAHAAQNLLETKTPIGKLRGHFHDHFGVKVMPTFHPAYLLRDPHKKREVWDDMRMVRDYLSSVS
ncbi:MAG: uracil-DNA glycosylase [Pyrinomonadaceae bacterium]